MNARSKGISSIRLGLMAIERRRTADMNSAITPAYCKLHGYRTDEFECSICLGTSNGGALYPIPGDLGTNGTMLPAKNPFSLDQFLAEVRDSCTNHAERKGYTSNQGSDKGDVLGPCLTSLGIAKDHSLGEIVAKLVEYKREPRRVLAVKVAGWAWRLWVNTEK